MAVLVEVQVFNSTILLAKLGMMSCSQGSLAARDHLQPGQSSEILIKITQRNLAKAIEGWLLCTIENI